jgi:hypothetical protein
MLVHNEEIAHGNCSGRCGAPHLKGKFKIYAVEAHRRHVLHLQVAQGQSHHQSGRYDALGVPIFTPH